MRVGEIYTSIEKHIDDFGKTIPVGTKFTVMDEVFGIFVLLSNDGFAVTGSIGDFNWLKKEGENDNNNKRSA